MADRTSGWGALASGLIAVASVAVLAGCGGQSTAGSSPREQVTAVARAYNHAFVTRDGKRICALMTPSLRRQLITPAGARMPRPSSCAEVLSFAAGTVRARLRRQPRGLSRARQRLARDRHDPHDRVESACSRSRSRAAHWRVDGIVRYTSRVWLKTDYRIRRSGGASASAVAGVLAERAQAIIGTPSPGAALGAEEVSLSVAEPVRPADLALVATVERRAARLLRLGSRCPHPGRAARRGRPSPPQPHRGPDQPGIGFGPRDRRGKHDPPRCRSGWPAGRDRAVGRWFAPGRQSAGAGPDAPQYYVLRDRPALSGADIQFAYADTDPFGNPDIVLDFTPRGDASVSGPDGRGGPSRRGARQPRPL